MASELEATGECESHMSFGSSKAWCFSCPRNLTWKPKTMMVFNIVLFFPVGCIFRFHVNSGRFLFIQMCIYMFAMTSALCLFKRKIISFIKIIHSFISHIMAILFSIFSVIFNFALCIHNTCGNRYKLWPLWRGPVIVPGDRSVIYTSVSNIDLHSRSSPTILPFNITSLRDLQVCRKSAAPRRGTWCRNWLSFVVGNCFEVFGHLFFFFWGGWLIFPSSGFSLFSMFQFYHPSILCGTKFSVLFFDTHFLKLQTSASNLRAGFAAPPNPAFGPSWHQRGSAWLGGWAWWPWRLHAALGLGWEMESVRGVFWWWKMM